MEHRFVDGKVHRASENSQEEKDKYSSVQETRWVGAKARIVDGGWGFEGASGGGWRINDRLTMVKLVIGGCTLSVISAYAPQVLAWDEAKKLFTRI
ncbi:hypothetical protein H5410_058591 [Solanum commersonii]|uniref:Uncharacterized protein n=1 Tax=Solanum commersonii TaxID=4109 RepID=A0A9J5WRJ0_SOLCO|nr:hypothetical protein H5410_058591 [Solanum commersonii]